jgi:hypothetical protein
MQFSKNQDWYSGLIKITFLWVNVQHLFSNQNYSQINETFMDLSFLPPLFEYLDEAMIVMMFLISLLIHRRIYTHRILLLFVPLSIISTILSGVPFIQMIFGLRSLFQNLLFCIMAYMYKPDLIEKFLKYLIYLAILNSVMLIIQMIYSVVMGGSIYIMDNGTGIYGFGHTHVAGYLNLSMLLLIVFGRVEFKSSLFTRNSTIILLISTSLLMQAKAGYISFIICSIIALTFFRSSFKSKLKNLFLFASMIALFIFVYKEYFNENVFKMMSPKNLYKSQTLQYGAKTTGGRVEIFNRTVDIIAKSSTSTFLFGFGSGNYMSSASTYFGGYGLKDIRQYYDRYVYNSGATPFIVVLIGEYGLIGLILFGLFLYTVFKPLLKKIHSRNNNAQAFTLMILFMLLISFSENIIEQQQASIIFWILTIIATSKNNTIANIRLKPINV